MRTTPYRRRTVRRRGRSMSSRMPFDKHRVLPYFIDMAKKHGRKKAIQFGTKAGIPPEMMNWAVSALYNIVQDRTRKVVTSAVKNSRPYGLAEHKITNTGSGISRSIYRTKGARISKWEKAIMAQQPALVMKENDRFALDSIVDKQGVINRSHAATAEWSKMLYNLAYRGNNYDNRTLTNDAIQGLGPSPSGKMHLTSCGVTTTITSTTDVNIRLKVLELGTARDVSESIRVGPDTTTHAYADFDPVSLWSEGITDRNYGTNPPGFNTTLSYNDLNCLPVLSSFFNSFYYIDKTYTIDLPAGATHVHTSYYNYNVTMPNLVVANEHQTGPNDAGYTYQRYIAGITRHQLFIVMGTPVHDTVDNNLVAVSPASVDIAQEMYYKAHPVPSRRSHYGDASVYNVFTSLEAMTDDDMNTTPIEVEQ